MAGVMGLITISFVVWGIGDIFRGFGLNSAVKIGNTEISIEQFRQFYNERLQQLSRRLGRAITPEQARALGLDQQALRQLIAETTLDEQAKALRLSISNADIIKRITADPAFRGRNGEFDRMQFELLIRQNGYSESRFVEEQRNVMLRRQIAQSISGELHVPLAAMTAIDQFQNEKRSIEYLCARRSPSRRHSGADAGGACQIFRGTQSFVPRAGISQDYYYAALACECRQAGASERRRRQEILRRPQE